MKRCLGFSLVGSVVLVAGLSIAVPGASAMTVTSTGESGVCTLRGAIQAAATNNSGTGCGPVAESGPTPINLPANTYTPSDGPLVVPAGAWIQINGDNVNNPLTTKIDGTGGTVGRVFTIASGATVTLSGLTVTGGRTPDAPIPASIFTFNPVDDGGGIRNAGSLTIDHSVIEGNRTGDGSNGAPAGANGAGGTAGPGGNGGGIYNADGGSLTVTDSVVRDNLTGNGGNGADGANGLGAYGVNGQGKDGGAGGYGGNGGGIYNSNSGSLSIDRTTISGNDTGRGGTGGTGGQGAGPFVTTPPGLDHPVEFSGQTGGWGGNGGDSGKAYCRGCFNTFTDQWRGGGGVYNLGLATITNSTVKGNTTGAGGNGGGSGPGGQRNLDTPNTFQSSGTAGYGGGGGRGAGLMNVGQTSGRMLLTNVTVTENVAGDGGNGGGGAGGTSSTLGGGPGGFGGDGGGIWASGGHNYETAVTHGTIAKNFVGGRGLGGASASANPSTNGERGVGAGIAVGSRYAGPNFPGLYLKNTLIASNGFPNTPTFDKNCVQQQNIDNYQEFGDQGSNLSYPNDGSVCPGLTNVDPDLNLLGDYGGPTQTIVPQPGSAAIGGVPLASCTTNTDQRGFPRPGADGVSCDIGAVETGTAPVITPTTMVLISSSQPASVGQQVTFTATVSPPPSSGTVAFTENGSPIAGCGAAVLAAGGQFTCSTSFGSAGDRAIGASYTGNSLFGASSNSITQSVGTAPPTDTTPPDTFIDSGPSGTVATNSVTFAFSGTPGDTVRIQCKMDSGSYANCISPINFPGLSNGPHTVSFRAEDAAGNVDPSPATRTFTVDVPPPPVAKIGGVTVTGPAGTKKGGKPTFKVKVTNTGNAAATGVGLRVSGGGANATRTIGGVPAGSSKTIRVGVRLNQVGRKKVTFKVTSANAGGKAATKTVTVRRPRRR